MDADGEVWKLWQQQTLFVALLLTGAVEVWAQQETLERAGDLLSMAALVYVAYRFRKWRRAAPPFRTRSTRSTHRECPKVERRRSFGIVSPVSNR